MFALRNGRVLLLVLLACCCMSLMPQTTPGQSDERMASSAERVKDVDLEVQLHLLVASNAGENTKLPASMEQIARELRSLLQFTNYRIGATFLSRVKNGRPLNLKGVSRVLLVTPALELSVNPTFYEVSAGTVTVKDDVAGRSIVQLSPFRFGLRIPLQMGSGRGNESSSPANIVYESVGITTDVTMREGEAVVVGTLDTGRPNETLVLVLIAKRASVRN